MIDIQEKSWFDKSVELVNNLTIDDLAPIKKRISSSLNRIIKQADAAKLDDNKSLPYSFYEEKWSKCHTAKWFVIINLPKHTIDFNTSDTRDKILFGISIVIKLNDMEKLVLKSMNHNKDISDIMEPIFNDVKEQLLQHLTQLSIDFYEKGLSLPMLYNKTTGSVIAYYSKYLRSNDKTITQKEVYQVLSNKQQENLCTYLEESVNKTIESIRNGNISTHILNKSIKELNLLINIDLPNSEILKNLYKSLFEFQNVEDLANAIAGLSDDIMLDWNLKSGFEFYKNFIIKYYDYKDLDSRGIIFMATQRSLYDIRSSNLPFRINESERFSSFVNRLSMTMQPYSTPVYFGPGVVMDFNIEVSYKNLIDTFTKIFNNIPNNYVFISKELFQRVSEMTSVIKVIYNDFYHMDMPTQFSEFYQTFTDVYQH